MDYKIVLRLLTYIHTLVLTSQVCCVFRNLPVYKKACLVDILLVVIKIVSYLILDRPSHLGVYYRYLCGYNRNSAGTF
jgi:hypothetical protein